MQTKLYKGLAPTQRNGNAAPVVLFVLNGRDVVYYANIRKEGFAAAHMLNVQPVTWTELLMHCKRFGATCVATTQYPLFGLMEGTRNDNAGHVWVRDDIRVVYLPDLVQAFSVPHGKFLIELYLSKLHSPHKFFTAPTFSYTRLGVHNVQQFVDLANVALFMAIDVETHRLDCMITHCSYSMYLPDGRIVTCALEVFPDWEQAFYCMSAMNSTRCAKLFQRGQYDCAYFLRFGIPTVNYLFDTYNMQHCMYSELDADLAFMTQMYTLGIRYWKEQALTDKLEYNARDTFATVCVFLGQLQHARTHRMDYVQGNYLLEFPIVFPCLNAGLEGFLVDEAERAKLKAIEEGKRDESLRWLQIAVHPQFNPGSWQQVDRLMKAIGYAEAEGTGKKEMQQFAEAHPFYALITQKIQEYRNSVKAIGTYYEFDLMSGRLLYEIDPAGTETGRCASKASQFWCGTQIQNIPGYSKGQFRADPGWLLCEPDGAQAESRCTAYISQDEALQWTVETSPDFHCTNASLFFAIPFDELYDRVHGKVKRKDIRTVAKRVNHGANYNMGAYVLWQTMGTKEVLQAKKVLGLPAHFDVFAVCRFLLAAFSKAYPRIKGAWYGEVVNEVLTTGKLVGATGWTRRTFLRPDRNKMQLNSVVAHHPQSLSVMLVNRGMLRIWKRQISDLNGIIRIKAQIHDSVPFQYRAEHEAYAVAEVSRELREACTQRVHGKVFTIPNDPKYGATYWSELKD